MEFNKVILDFAGEAGNVAVLRFNHPEVLNAIGTDMLEGINDALREVQDPNNGARCLLVTGEGRGFCAGANLADPKRDKAAGPLLRTDYHPLLLALRDLDMPIVTAVNGAAAGVGMSFAIPGRHRMRRQGRLLSASVRPHRPGCRTAAPPSCCRALSAGGGRWSCRFSPSGCQRRRRRSGAW